VTPVKVSAELLARVREVLKDGALPRRTVAYRAGCSEATVGVLCRQRVLKVVGREKHPSPMVPKHYWHPIVDVAA